MRLYYPALSIVVDTIGTYGLGSRLLRQADIPWEYSLSSRFQALELWDFVELLGHSVFSCASKVKTFELAIFGLSSEIMLRAINPPEDRCASSAITGVLSFLLIRFLRLSPAAVF